MLLAGCIYDTALENEPAEAAEKKFAGDWVQVGEPENRLIIRPFDAKNYLAVTLDEKAAGTYRAFTSTVDDLRLANVQALGGDIDGKWAFFAYRFDDSGRLALRMINEQVVSPDLKTPEALRKAIAENRKNPDLFLQETVYAREITPPPEASPAPKPALFPAGPMAPEKPDRALIVPSSEIPRPDGINAPPEITPSP